MLSFSTPEYVVRKTVSAISSAIEKMAFLNSSNSIGSMPYYPWMSKDSHKERMMARNTRKPAAQRQRPSTRARPQRRLIVLVATRKGAWLYHGDAARKTWRADGPHFLGHVISHAVLDPRDGRTLLAAAKTGHLGPTVFRSTDLGRTWKEAAQPPAIA